MKNAQPATIFLKDYKAPAYRIEKTELDFQLYEDYALVTAQLHIQRAPDTRADEPLVLHGQDLTLEMLAIDDRELTEQHYQLGDETLRIDEVPARFILHSRARIYPQNNTSLEGLYKSRTMFCTQCEAEGFRKITWYLDRPDVMSVFTVSVEAEQKKYPVLLSNGNRVGAEDCGNGRHRAIWHDPFPKPAYLFALVAGDLVSVDDQFTTCSGRDVNLHIFVEEKDRNKCAHAMDSLKRSMRWDEEVFGREYDLDIFNIVAVDDFNMGAMENKSLNIFNSSCVLARPDITTDAGFQNIEAIVAHEYFHNWSGNRVTCRDWFQLSLKEGFTVFRDAEFSSDMGSRTVKRVEDVAVLRNAQFAEDAGPMAHPIRPASFIEISNFYTVTVYEKGAEVVRMIHTLLGAEDFRRGSDLYFDRHDGQAATCEDFVKAMEDASGHDLTQFRRWYSQAGTPQLKVNTQYDSDAQTYTLNVEQSCPATPGQSEKAPFSIPLAMGLLGDAGNLPLQLEGEAINAETADNTSTVLLVNEAQQQFVFTGVKEKPVPSLLRGFSAPVRLDYNYSDEDLSALMARDDDGFVRWNAAQTLAVRSIKAVQAAHAAGEKGVVSPLLLTAGADLLADTSLDSAMLAHMLVAPDENTLAETETQHHAVDVQGLHRAREQVCNAMAKHWESQLVQRYHDLATKDAYAPDADQIAARSLRNLCLSLLMRCGDQHWELARQQFSGANNMTDQLAALRALVFYADCAAADCALNAFYDQWREETLVVNQWFQMQALSPSSDTLGRVVALQKHADFDLKNPNKVRSLIGAFCSANPINFHQSGGYKLLGDTIAELDKMNPQIASRLATPLTKWRKYATGHEMMRAELERLAALPDLSRDVFEVVSKSLADAS